MDWSSLYPAFFASQDVSCEKSKVEFADIGCGYGGLIGNTNKITKNVYVGLIANPLLSTCLLVLYVRSLNDVFPKQASIVVEVMMGIL